MFTVDFPATILSCCPCGTCCFFCPGPWVEFKLHLATYEHRSAGVLPIDTTRYDTIRHDTRRL